MASLPNKNTQISQSSSSASTTNNNSDRRRNRDWDQDFSTDLSFRRRGRPSITTQYGTNIILPPPYQQSSVSQYPPTMISGGAGGSGSGSAGASSSSSNVYADPRSVVLQRPLPPVPLFHPNYDVNVRGLRFLFEKKLKPSDVSQGRIIIPKREAEACLPRLQDKDGILLKVHDVDRVRVWSFRFKFWPNNESRMYLLENTLEFVKDHDLVSGDYALFYIDRQSGFYYVRAQKNIEIPTLTVAREAIPQFSRVSLDIEVYTHNQYINFSTMEEELAKPPFLFDTALTSDRLLVCAKLDPLPEFGSEESIWFDDFL